MPVYESDVCIIGAGITSAMLAEKLSELHPGVSINIVEAGRSIFDLENRYKYRERMIKYGENPWPGDTIEGQAAAGGISRTMAVGGQALHWGGTCNRFSEEDLRLKSMYGLYADWPMEWAELAGVSPLVPETKTPGGTMPGSPEAPEKEAPGK